jgi:mannitol/fructose-specific phosphotransferase system IIA component (Ntr-type)
LEKFHGNKGTKAAGLRNGRAHRTIWPPEHNIFMNAENDRSVTEQQLPAEATGLPEPLTVANALAPERINIDLQATEREGVLRELSALVIDPRQERLFDTFLQALKAREDMCPTCVTEGVAIPHSRNALVGLVDQPVIAYGRHKKGVDFGALDGKPVHHFFLLCAPNVRQHLQLLARLARLVGRSKFRTQLSAMKKPEEVISLIREAEAHIASS